MSAEVDTPVTQAPEAELTPGRTFVCTACGWEYDEDDGLPDAGYPAGTRFQDLPWDFTCPECGVGKARFVEA